MLVQIDSYELARLRTDATKLKHDELKLTAKCTCNQCKHLMVINGSYIYAICKKTNYIFKPFDMDTRKHFCSFAEGSNGHVY